MKTIIVDSYSLLYKAYFGVREMHTTDGIPTNAIFGFINMLIKLVKEYKPDRVLAAFDAGKHTFRNDIFKEYKAGRDHMPEDMFVQVEAVKDILENAGISIISLDGFEADDIIGSCSRINDRNSDMTIVVTGDRDSFQLATTNTNILYAKHGVSDTVVVDIKYIKETYGLEPIDMIQLKALMGDKSDNIPGVPGVGEKTALTLINEYKTLDNLYNNIDSIKGKLKDKLINGKTSAYMSLELGTIKTDIALSSELFQPKEVNFSSDGCITLLKKYELNSIIKQLGIVNANNNDAVSDTDTVEFKLLSGIEHLSVNEQVFFMFYESFGSFDLYIKTDEKFIYHTNNKDIIKKFFEDSSIKKVSHDLKKTIKSLMAVNIRPHNLTFDTYICAYLLNPSDERYSLDVLAKKYLGMDLKINEGSKQISLFDDRNISREDVSKSLFIIMKLYPVFIESLKSNNMEFLYYSIEHKLITVLAEMEYYGFKLDVKMLDNLGEEFENRCKELDDQIRIVVNLGPDFNINSTKQLGDLLFNQLGLPVVKKTKTGFSTDIEVLEKLKDKHPVIPLIIELRQVNKLNSTYIKGMGKLTDDNNFIHSSFNQTITTTGRISSSEPNLQNIPVRTDEGRILRKLFIPSDNDHILIDADYSQIELRVLAHISSDKNMIMAFKNGEDIHARTASEVFNIPLDEVTKEQRSKAKAVNFGIVYGITDYGLSRNIGISRSEAKEYIDEYLRKFSGVKKYMNDIVAFAHENGFVETMFKRKRYLSDINSKSFTTRNFAERTAMNTPIQGTAADIIKIAMVNVFEKLKENSLESKLILQVHDELIIDAKRDELDLVKKILKTEMENAVSLNVPLIAEIGIGNSWYEAK